MNNTLNIQDASFDIGVNVIINQRDKNTGRVLQHREKHNRCLKNQLMGIIKWLNGEFNPSQSHLVHYDWIPRYLGIGTNSSTGFTPAGVTSEVTTDDSALLHEISPRIKLPERNSIVNKSSQNYIQLIIVTYLPEELYQDEWIGEAGLFSGETGNNCLFRVVFDPFQKTTDTVVEVNWTISVISVDSQNSPYEELDKVDLRKALNMLLDRFAELDPRLAEVCEHMKSPGIYEYGRSDSTQESVDAATALLGEDYAKLKDL